MNSGNNMKTKLFLLDLGGVIFKLNWQKTFNLVDIPLSFEETYKILFHSSFLEDYETGKINDDEFYKQFQSKTNMKNTKEEFFHAWDSVIDGVIDGIAETLNWAKSKCSLMALTNTNARHYDILWSLLDKNHFEHIFASHLLGVRKPEKEIFNIVLEHTQLSPKEVLFIDDTQENLLAAKELGLKTSHSVNSATMLKEALLAHI